MRTATRPLLLAIVVGLLAALSTTASATQPASDGGTYAPLDDKGPKLSVSNKQLRAALQCNGSLEGLDRDPVLLVPGTQAEPFVNFDWNYMPALEQEGVRWCAVTLPFNATGDIQVAGEYLVASIRTMHRRAERQVDVVGYSQGGMVPRWALRWWPDVRERVDDVVGLSPSNHGTVLAEGEGEDVPANLQQAASSNFMDALNSRAETFAGIDYTVAYTYEDEIVVPNTPPAPSSALRTGDGAIANIALQELCPANLADHFEIGTSDPVAWAIVIDALRNDGPADARRVLLADPLLCARVFMPGVDETTYVQDNTELLRFILSDDGDAEEVAEEPPLRDYVFAD